MPHPRYTGTVIDAHTHFDFTSGDLVEKILDKANIDSCVNLWDIRWPPRPFEQWSAPWKRLGQRMLECHVPDISSIGTPCFASGIAEGVRRAAANGACGIKVWKNLGLWLRDPSGRRISVDDDRLRVLWETAAEVHLPVVIHVGDPPAFFEPVTPDNERYQELLEHPEWWFGGGQYPALQTIHEEFERVVEANRGTAFVGAHFGCFMPFGGVARMLHHYDNYFVDTSARVADLGRGDVSEVREIFRRYPDRIVFGTDLIRTAGLDMPDTGSRRGDVSTFYELHWRFFETGERELPHPLSFQGDWTVTGLDLDQDTLALLYRGNAEALFGLFVGR